MVLLLVDNIFRGKFDNSEFNGTQNIQNVAFFLWNRIDAVQRASCTLIDETGVWKPWRKKRSNVAVLLATTNICRQKRQQRGPQTQLISQINCPHWNQFWDSAHLQIVLLRDVTEPSRLNYIYLPMIFLLHEW